MSLPRGISQWQTVKGHPTEVVDKRIFEKDLSPKPVGESTAQSKATNLRMKRNQEKPTKDGESLAPEEQAVTVSLGPEIKLRASA